MLRLTGSKDTIQQRHKGLVQERTRGGRMQQQQYTLCSRSILALMYGPQRRFVVVTACLALTLGMFLLFSAPSASSKKQSRLQRRSDQRFEYTRRAIADAATFRPHDVLIVSHRGCIGRFPENTLAAIAACSQEGAHVVEIDVDRTADGHLVLMHDDTIDRMTNRQQWAPLTSLTAVSNLTLAQIQSSEYRIVMNEYTGVVTNFNIPTFEQAIETAKRCGIHLYIDIKGRSYVEELLVHTVDKANAFDYVLIKQFTSYQPPPELASKIRLVNYIRDSAKANDAMTVANKPATATGLWHIGGELRFQSETLCSLRERTKMGLMWSMLWIIGDYYLRDPDWFVKRPMDRDDGDVSIKFAQLYGLSTDKSKKSAAVPAKKYPITHEPCVDSTNMEDACLGAHLYQPLVTATCARLIVTDMPGTVRAALLASNQMAPTSIYPIEPFEEYADGQYHRLAKMPQCLDM